MMFLIHKDNFQQKDFILLIKELYIIKTNNKINQDCYKIHKELMSNNQ